MGAATLPTSADCHLHALRPNRETMTMLRGAYLLVGGALRCVWAKGCILQNEVHLMKHLQQTQLATA